MFQNSIQLNGQLFISTQPTCFPKQNVLILIKHRAQFVLFGKVAAFPERLKQRNILFLFCLKNPFGVMGFVYFRFLSCKLRSHLFCKEIQRYSSQSLQCVSLTQQMYSIKMLFDFFSLNLCQDTLLIFDGTVECTYFCNSTLQLRWLNSLFELHKMQKLFRMAFQRRKILWLFVCNDMHIIMT